MPSCEFSDIGLGLHSLNGSSDFELKLNSVTEQAARDIVKVLQPLVTAKIIFERTHTFSPAAHTLRFRVAQPQDKTTVINQVLDVINRTPESQNSYGAGICRSCGCGSCSSGPCHILIPDKALPDMKREIIENFGAVNSGPKKLIPR